MAKTIKEMASEYAVNKRHIMPRAIAYCDGANAVLEEIVKFADSTWGSRSLNTISLKKKIETLKG